ncbi:MetQ/NlpA family ABC transporter substrate-binding protein [Mycobacterium sp. 236(2023)]|uniref:MetQ/NlpA family ABC transporter substrate-binding protein n=1 Tax=Mycobacterium sp. 236(2023) TaxID=3038163 RepID=UPI002414F76C|nr:MetQ/NlpA family ABC transporter substrate-binding protein [Mycobacterium sp. 236(2023)]MDG4667619.1 MetQ/NlpA family ABC transporter substrate-binding protein [Mycobacterium sp. 236(2023)]
MSLLRNVQAIVCAVMLAVSAAGCSDDVPVTYQDGRASGDILRIHVGGEGYRDVLEFVSQANLAGGVQIELTDAAEATNSRIVDGDADLAFYQTQPAFLGNQEANGHDTLSIVSKVDVAPYALYSSRWKDLAPTEDWVNSPLGEDKITAHSLPHGAMVAVPQTKAGFARSLYLLQSVDLVTLDRAFGGLTLADLSITEANVLESQRHLALRALDFSEYAADIYKNFDAVVFDTTTAASIGLVPARDALAIEAGPGNPYARVLVAPSRLAGDPRVSALAHALESKEVADYLARTYQGKFISAQLPFNG